MSFLDQKPQGEHLANGHRDFMEDLMAVVRQFHDMPWDDERLAEAMEFIWHRGIQRGRALERNGAHGTEHASDSNPTDQKEEVPIGS